MNSIGGKILHGTFWLTLSKFFIFFFTSAATIFIARWLGPDNYGYIPLVTSIIGISIIFADAGVASSAARFLAEVPENHQKTRSLLTRTFKLHIFFMVPICLGLYLVTDWLSMFLDAPLLPRFGWLISLLLALQTMQRWIAKVCEGTGNAHLLGKVSLLIDWTKPTLQIVLVLAGFGLLGVFVGQAVASSLIVGVFLLFLIKKFYSKESLHEKVEPIVSISNIIFYAFPLIATQAASFVYMQSDILMLKYFRSVQDVSYYGIAIKIVSLIRMPASALGASAAPLVMISQSDSIQRARDRVLKILKYLLVIFAFVSLVIFIYAKEIVLIPFSVRYLFSVKPLQIYSIFIFFSAISTFASLALDYSGLAKTRMFLVSASASLNVLLNMILIPKHGMIGAAWATQITYPPLVIAYIWLIAKHYQMPFLDLLKMTAKLFGIVLLIIVILWLYHRSFGRENILLSLLGILIGGSLYLYMAYKVNLINKDELLSLLGGRFRK